MLGKLIKHDFRSLSRVLLPTQFAVLGASVIATVGFAINFRENSSAPDSAFMAILRLISSLVSGLLLVAVIAASLLAMFIIFQRFYKSLMGDEGYLSFTLPVSTAQILWSKLITALLWTLINACVIFVCINIFVLFGTGRDYFINLEAYRTLFKALGDAGRLVGADLILLPAVELLLLALVMTVYEILHVYLALIVGGVVSHKHKLLAGIGFYFVINIVVSVLSTTAQYFTTSGWGGMLEQLSRFEWVGSTGPEIYRYVVNALQSYFWLNLIFSAVVGTGFFLLSRYLLKNKLNLE
jgi:hypothetical protein